MVRVLARRMAHHEPWWAELGTAVGAIAWCGAAALLSDGLDHLPAFKVLVAVAPPWAWYAVGVALPLAQIEALRRDDRRARWRLALAMTLWWSFLFWAVWLGMEAVTPGVVFYLLCAAGNVCTVVLLRVPEGRVGFG